MPNMAWTRGSLVLAALVCAGASIAPAAEALTSSGAPAAAPTAPGDVAAAPVSGPAAAPSSTPDTVPAVFVTPAGSSSSAVTSLPNLSAATVDTIRSDADWVMQSRLPDGAIASYTDHEHVMPYLANFAAMGLSRATELTGNAGYVGAAWSWLDWYAAHQNASGYVTDYDVTNGREVSTGSEDSTDAYAGTFLLAAYNAWQASSDAIQLDNLHVALTNAVAAIESTQQADGLTWSKPSWSVAYLMDEVEVLAGLQSAANLAGPLGDPALAQRATRDATTLSGTLQSLWNGNAGSFSWAVHGNGAHIAANYGVFYPDTAEEAWASAFGVAGGTNAAAIAGHIRSSEPAWQQPTATVLQTTDATTSPAKAGYWPMFSLALLQGGDTDGAATGAAAIQAAGDSTGRAWPFSTATAGQLVLALSADSSFVPTLP